MKRRSGISRLAAVAVVVAIVAISGIAVYFISYSSLDGTHTTTTRFGTSSTSMTSSVSTTTRLNRSPQTLNELFDIFSQMTVYSRVFDPEAGVTSQNSSYMIIGLPTINSTLFHEVKFTIAGSQNQSATVWFSPSGNASLIEIANGINYTGSLAISYGQLFAAPFLFTLTLAKNASVLAGLQNNGSHLETLGTTQVNVSSYQLTSPNSTYRNLATKIGLMPETNISIMVYLYQVFGDNSTNLDQVINLTMAS